MLFTSDFRQGEDKKEILPMDSQGFPYICNYSELDAYIEKSFPWHWHSEFEIDYVEEGEVELRTADTMVCVKKGEAFFVNSNVMHDIRAKDRMKNCKTYAHLFDLHFLSGMYNSIFEQKYIFPILKSKKLQIFVIRPDHYQTLLMMEKILRMIELNVQEPFGYEFEIRSELSRFWCMLLAETETIRSQNIETNGVDIERVKTMMQYIHEHYMERLTLGSIANAANISNRECARCFQRCIGISPVNYLNDYRVRMAAQMLLQTSDSVLTISENCGFSSSSYFARVFHDAMNCTPKEYRRDH